jgi:hypothetical protein
MCNNEQISLENGFNEFLERACEIAQGDTAKTIKIIEIWKSLHLGGISEEVYAPKIMKSLIANGFILPGNKNDEIRVTYNGIYYIIDKFRISPENLGVLSYNDLNKYLDPFLEQLYKETEGDTAKSVSIYDIQNKRLKAFGNQPIRQISEFLKMKGLIEGGETPDSVRVPSKQIKKPYEAPSKRKS